MADLLGGSIVTLWAETSQKDNGGLLQFLLGPALPFVMIALLAWLMFFRPEGRRRAEFAKLLAGLKKNDRVLTAGGLYGTIVNAPKDSEDVTLKIDEAGNVRVRVLRTAITRVVNSDEESGETGKSE
ncbi:MAG: preprotein translocase subunit YajC [Pirellulales bacterium]